MNPNSQHQLWSRWDVTITPPRKAPARPGDDDVRAAWARFVSRCFHTTAGEVRCERRRGGGLFSLRPRVQWFAQARIEGVPAHDPDYRDRIKARIVTFWGSGLGSGTDVHIEVRIEAGDVQDGTAPAQLVMLPTLVAAGANHALVPLPPMDNVAGPEALTHGKCSLP